MSRIKVFIPTFNRQKLLKRATESVLIQTFKDFELHIVDNCSLDDTESYIHEVMQKDARVKYHRHSQNIGPFKNFEYCFSQINGCDFFCFLTDDDFYLPNFFNSAIEKFNEEPNISSVVQDVIYISSNGAIVGYSLEQWDEGLYLCSAQNSKIIMEKRRPPVFTGFIYKTEVLSKVPNFRKAAEGFEDYDYTYRILDNFNFYVLKKVSLIYFVNVNSVGFNMNPFNFRERWTILESYFLEKYNNNVEITAILNGIHIHKLENLKANIRFCLKTKNYEGFTFLKDEVHHLGLRYILIYKIFSFKLLFNRFNKINCFRSLFTKKNKYSSIYDREFDEFDNENGLRRLWEM